MAFRPRRDVRRTFAHFRAFRSERTSPDDLYSMMAADAVATILAELNERGAPRGPLVLDVGGGPGYVEEAFAAAGACCITTDYSFAELHLHSRRPRLATIADGQSLCHPGETFDIVHCSNVLEHVPRPHDLLEELVRVCRPGGIMYLSFTNWLSPWGGHETSPWHYLGGERAARIYARRRGLAPKNRFGTSLYPVSVGSTLRWLRQHPDVELLSARPRYYPGWARFIVSLPGLREVVTWNLEVVARRR